MRYLMWTALAAGALFAVQGASQANDTVRLGGPSAQAAIDGGTDTERVLFWGHAYRRGYRAGYYGGGWGGGYRSYWGGGYGYGYGGYYRPYYAGYYRPYYGYASYYSPYYYSSYSYYPYYANSYYSDYCYPIAGNGQVPATTLQQATNILPAPRQSAPVMPPSTDGTYPYNGGPQNVAPMPPASEAPPAPGLHQRQPGIMPIDAKLVSLPQQTGGGVSTQPAVQGWRALNTSTRIAYPAYGENLVPSPRR